jgi:heme-degrading monooxygenase HmoA
MIAVIFEVHPVEGGAERYFEIAGDLRPLLEKMDGFVSVERFQSVSQSDRYLSLSFWRDEAAVRAWRCHGMHRKGQQEGRNQVFQNYRIRVAEVVRDYGLTERVQAPEDSNAFLI